MRTDTRSHRRRGIRRGLLPTLLAGLLAGLLVVLLPSGVAMAQESAAELLDQLMTKGDTGRAESLLATRVAADPDDLEAAFALGGVRLLAALTGLVQDAFRYGLGGGGAQQGAMLFGLPLPPVRDAEEIGYDDLRAAFERFRTGLADANAALAAIGEDDAVTLRLEPGSWRIDLNGDGVAADDERVSLLLAQLGDATGQAGPDAAEAAIPIAFDTGDALWLRGYATLLGAVVDLLLALDGRELWDATAQLFFPRPDTAHPFLRSADGPNVQGLEAAPIADLIMFVHGLDLPVTEPERVERAHAALLAVPELSRASWRAIRAETDDDREWLPNPRQTGVIPSTAGGPPVAIDDAQIDAWLALLDETEAILEGRSLIPHWRVTDGRGVNLRRALLESRRFDLIGWAHGVAAAPFLETGPVTDPDAWRDIVRAFGDNFAGFALWFN